MGFDLEAIHPPTGVTALPIPEDLLSSALLFLRAKDLFEWRLICKSAVTMFASEAHVSGVTRRLLMDLHSSRDRLNNMASLSLANNAPSMSDDLLSGHGRGRPRCLKIGHKGAEGHIKGNTIPSFLEAIRLGVNVIEFDVLTTQDGVVICHHDPLIEATGEWVANLTLAETRARLGQHICTFEDMLRNQTLLSSTVQLYVDMKHTNIVRPVMHALRNAVGRWGWPADRLLVATFRQLDLLEVNAFRRALPELSEIRTVCIMDGVPLGLAKEYEAMGVSVMSVGKDHIIPELVEDAHRRGIQIWTWTVNSSHHMDRLLGLGVDGMCGDFPEKLEAAIQKFSMQDQDKQEEADGLAQEEVAVKEMLERQGVQGDAHVPDHHQLLGMVYKHLSQVRNEAVAGISEAREVMNACHEMPAVQKFLSSQAAGSSSSLMIASVQSLLSQSEADAERALRPIVTSTEAFEWAMRLFNTEEGRRAVKKSGSFHTFPHVAEPLVGREFMANARESMFRERSSVTTKDLTPLLPMLPFEKTFVHDLLGLTPS
ncbi:unnamed protein product [Discosporangium mesarthrocarpum]